MEFITKYYGLDWLAVIFGLIAIYQIGNKKKLGIILYIVSAAFSLIFALVIHSIPFIVVNIITIGMQIQAYTKWLRDERRG